MPPASMATLTGWFATAFCNDFSSFCGTSSYPSMVTTCAFFCIGEKSNRKSIRRNVESGLIKHLMHLCICMCVYMYPVGITTSISSLVRVILFGVNAAIFDDEFECIVHETSIASLVILLVTINQLLLRQGD